MIEKIRRVEDFRLTGAETLRALRHNFKTKPDMKKLLFVSCLEFDIKYEIKFWLSCYITLCIEYITRHRHILIQNFRPGLVVIIS
ncbi:hypothetical protein NQ315_007373 [Exocentrus adspersus]|uniref:Uncharacterized protein n=1 Tax=Exocentrus adspersus TaxID=1586481 RepID=A0AAV8VIC4_9CUCU|nr:hypothetical protein NQ315_007373 [Exocentrus adspersus]